MAVAGPANTGDPPARLYEGFATGNRIDELVGARLKKNRTPPSPLCSDEVFVRRVFLDVIGTLPTPAETRSFLSDRQPDKRNRMIDALLDRPEFADYWGLKWGDLLRVKSEFPGNLWPNAVQAYDRWIRDRLRDNVPYDRWVRELLTASGSNFRVPPANYYRAFQERSPRQIAENVALVFLGLRLGESGFSEKQILRFSAFFANVGYKGTDEWKEEIVFFNPDGQLLDPKTRKPVPPRALDGNTPDLPEGGDPRAALADWLVSKRNPWFARCVANRVWYWLMGRGLVHEPDDLRPDNAPWCPKLLAYLEKELVAHAFDLKSLYRLILTSNTYQLDSRPNPWNAADETGFSHYRIRRLDAEPLLDAINQILGGRERYVSPIPEPFTILPPDQRAIRLADGSMESPFLELFGRPPRNTSFESERTILPSVFQAQYLLNASPIQKKIENSELVRPAGNPGNRAAWKFENVPNPQRIEDLYIRILSRFPTDDERKAALAYLDSPNRTASQSAADLVWALINTKEFLLRH